MSTIFLKYRRYAMLALLCLPLAAAANGLGCRQVAGIEEPTPCEAVSDCPEPASPCLAASCVDGGCAYEAVAAGSATPSDETGDCKKIVCDSEGNASVEDDETDSDDGDPCTVDSCEGGAAQHEPATEVACYTGPSETNGEGNCKPGLAECANGQLGECVGQVLPADETCDEPGDEDCDGMANEGGIGCDCEAGETQPCYTGDPLSEGVGTCAAGTQSCNASGMGFGECTGEVTPAATDDCATGDADEDCNGLPDCQGRTEWYANTVGPLPQEIIGVALAADGSIVVAGTVSDTFTFQSETATSTNSTDDVFVAKLDPTTGAIQWFTRFAGNCSEKVGTLTISPAGDIIVTGRVFFPLSGCSVNGVAIVSEGATLPRHFVVRMGDDGNIINTKQLDMHYVYSVAATATELFIAGRRYSPAMPSNISYYANKYDLNGVPSGTTTWLSGYELKALYAEGNNIWAAGLYSGTVGLPDSFDFTSSGGTDIFVARITSNFSFTVAASFGGTGDDAPTAIYADAGGVYLGGSFASPTIDLGADTLTNSDASKDAFVAKLTNTLSPMGALQIGGTNEQSISSISRSGPGLSVAGQFRGVLTLAGLPGDVISNGNTDTFVTRVMPDTLQPVWRRVVGGADYDYAWAAGGPDGETYYAARIFGPVDIDDTQAGVENSTETSDEGYVMRMAP